MAIHDLQTRRSIVKLLGGAVTAVVLSAVVLSAGGCSGSQSAPSTGSTAPEPASAAVPIDSGPPGALRQACVALRPVATESKRYGDSYVQAVDAAAEAAPPELKDGLVRLRQVVRSLQEEGLDLSNNLIDELATEAHDVNHWYRHHCVGGDASSPWCDEVNDALLSAVTSIPDTVGVGSDPSVVGSIAVAIKNGHIDFIRRISRGAPEEMRPALDILLRDVPGADDLQAQSDLSARVMARCSIPLPSSF